MDTQKELFTEQELNALKTIAESHCPDFINGDERLNWIEGAISMAYHLKTEKVESLPVDSGGYVEKMAVEIVKKLVAWSNKYPRSIIYPETNKQMDNELIEIEEQAKLFTTKL